MQKHIPCLCSDLPSSGSVFQGIVDCPWHHYSEVKMKEVSLKTDYSYSSTVNLYKVQNVLFHIIKILHITELRNGPNRHKSKNVSDISSCLTLCTS